MQSTDAFLLGAPGPVVSPVEWLIDRRLFVGANLSDLICRDEKIKVPTGPGFGVQIDPDFIKRSQIVN